MSQRTQSCLNAFSYPLWHDGIHRALVGLWFHFLQRRIISFLAFMEPAQKDLCNDGGIIRIAAGLFG